jgi:hypothetical protein
VWQNSENKLIDFIMIDTVVLCGQPEGDWDHRPLKGPENSDLADQYWEWIESELRKSKYALVIFFLFFIFSVVLHVTIYS